MAVVGKTAAHGAASSFGSAASNMGGDNDELIILLMVVSAGLIFIDHDRSGKPQSGNQFIALGIIGFVLLLLDRFWSEVAVGLAMLFTVSIVLNTPNGIPFVSSGPTIAPGTPNKPGEVGYGAAIVPVNQQTGVAQ